MDNKTDIICHPLRPVCVLLNVLSAHLYRKNFISPNLSDPLVKADTVIRFLDAVPEQKQIAADPTVSYSVGPFTMQPTQHGAVTGEPLIDLRGVISMEVSTASKTLTQELAFELGAVCMAMRPLLKPEQCFILGSQVSGVKLDDKSTFFLATTSINISLGYPIWNTTELEGTLREIRLRVNTPGTGSNDIIN